MIYYSYAWHCKWQVNWLPLWQLTFCARKLHSWTAVYPPYMHAVAIRYFAALFICLRTITITPLGSPIELQSYKATVTSPCLSQARYQKLRENPCMRPDKLWLLLRRVDRMLQAVKHCPVRSKDQQKTLILRYTWLYFVVCFTWIYPATQGLKYLFF